MKALIRRLRSDSAVHNQQVLGILADKLEHDLRLMVEGLTPEAGVHAMREINASVARIHAEYRRMKMPTPFTMPKEK